MYGNSHLKKKKKKTEQTHNHQNFYSDEFEYFFSLISINTPMAIATNDLLYPYNTYARANEQMLRKREEQRNTTTAIY